MKKIALVYSIIFLLALSLISAMASRAKSPGSLLHGEWKEIKWEYERSADPDSAALYEDVKQDVKQMTGNELVIHQAESWQFFPDGTLQLLTPAGQKFSLSWKLKGRGHILELNNQGVKEYYNIMQLTDDNLVVNFESDLEVRGIAKLTFKRVKNNHDLKVQQQPDT